MTTVEMKYEFQIKNELIADLSNPDLEDDEISLFLNNAQDKIVEELYKASGTEFLTELLTTLDTEMETSYVEITNAKSDSWNTMSDDLMFYVDAAVRINRASPEILSEWIQCEKIDKRISHNFAHTGFNIPWFKKPKIFLEDNDIVVIYDYYTVLINGLNNLKLEYIKFPTRIDITDGTPCELREFLHMDVVNKAIEMLMESYEDNSRQIQGRRQ